jgi:divalent metal cation (Fe/Co/Zn/Cd) transporter
MGTTEYVTYLFVAVLLTVVVGQVLLRSGQPFLEEVFRSNETAHSLNVLLSVLFHLLTLGVLALLSTIDVPIEAPLQATVTRFGVALLVVGIAYGVSMLVLLRIRERRRQAVVSDRIDERLAEQRRRPAPTADPVPPPPPA